MLRHQVILQNDGPRFVKVILPIQTRLLQNALFQAKPIAPRLNQAFSWHNFSPMSKNRRTLNPDQISATKCLNICP